MGILSEAKPEERIGWLSNQQKLETMSLPIFDVLGRVRDALGENAELTVRMESTVFVAIVRWDSGLDRHSVSMSVDTVKHKHDFHEHMYEKFDKLLESAKEFRCLQTC